jgi:hypothetical protein
MERLLVAILLVCAGVIAFGYGAKVAASLDHRMAANSMGCTVAIAPEDRWRLHEGDAASMWRQLQSECKGITLRWPGVPDTIVY